MVAIAVMFLILALSVATYSGVVLARANAGRRIPFWRTDSDYRHPFASRMLLAAAALLAGIGGVLGFDWWGMLAIFFPTVVWVPPLIVGVLHNRSIAATQPTTE